MCFQYMPIIMGLLAAPRTLVADFSDLPKHEARGIVDENVQPPVPRQHKLHQRCDAALHRDVHLTGHTVPWS